MGRIAQGWRIVWRRGVGHVRFTHQGKRHEHSTGQRARGAALEKAAFVYAEVVAGRWGQVKGVARVRCELPISKLATSWLADLESDHDEDTVGGYEDYARKWVDFFDNDLSKASRPEGWKDYVRDRLTKAVRSTVQKELSAGRGFLSWCVEKGYLSEAPVVAAPAPRAAGTPTGVQRRASVPLSVEQVEKLLLTLPVWGGKGENRFVVRAYFVVRYETSLRGKTLARLCAPEHYRRGQLHLNITKDVDKARHNRPVPLTPAARDALDQVCPDVGLLFGKHDYREVWSKAVALCKLPRETAPSDLRHGRITHMLDAGAPLTGVAYVAGHKQVSTTNKYARPNAKAAEQALMMSERNTGAILGSMTENKKKRRKGTVPKKLANSIECEGGDLNPYVLRHQNLNPVFSENHWTFSGQDGTEFSTLTQDCGVGPQSAALMLALAEYCAAWPGDEVQS